MTLLIRKAKLCDVDALVDLALEYAVKTCPEMRPDRAKIRRLVVEAISGPSNFAEVAEQDGRVQAVLIALVHDALWAERKVCNVLLWVSKLAGAGRRLLKQLKSWASARRAIRLIGLSPMFDWPATVTEILRRAGFQSRGGSFVLFN